MPREHAEQIKLWADREDAEVWLVSESGFWSIIDKPSWLPKREYVVVLPEYKEAWLAWLDGELEVKSGSIGWEVHPKSKVPFFNVSSDKYRRKPKIPTLDDVGKECFFTSDHSPDFRHKGILCGVATCADVEYRFMDARGGLWEHAELTGE